MQKSNRDLLKESIIRNPGYFVSEHFNVIVMEVLTHEGLFF